MNYTEKQTCEVTGVSVLYGGHYGAKELPDKAEFNKPKRINDFCDVCHDWHPSTVTFFIELTPQIQNAGLPDAPWSGSDEGRRLIKNQ